jgi:hypothetical protein
MIRSPWPEHSKGHTGAAPSRHDFRPFTAPTLHFIKLAALRGRRLLHDDHQFLRHLGRGVGHWLWSAPRPHADRKSLRWQSPDTRKTTDAAPVAGSNDRCATPHRRSHSDNPHREATIRARDKFDFIVNSWGHRQGTGCPTSVASGATTKVSGKCAVR